MIDNRLGEIDLTQSGAQFDLNADVVAQARPFVLRGLVADWPASCAASSTNELCDYLRGFANSNQSEIFIGAPAIEGRYFYGTGPDGFNFSRAQATVADAIDIIAQRAADPSLGSAYLGSSLTETYLPGFAKANVLAGLDASVQPRIWIGNPSNVAAHYDVFDNVACVIAGRRRFTLYPPDTIGDLYVGPIDHTMAGQPVSLAASDPDNIERYPRFVKAKARALVADLGPGDALYLPKLWWHQVEACAPFNVLVNYWWDAFAIGPDKPMLSMLLAMIAIGERPLAEREAFKAFFDHYVFRPDGHPLAHLPDDERGILRGIDRAAYGRIRASIMRDLRG